MKFFISSIVFFMLTSPALAASTAGRVDHSGLLVWVFLGFCALVVVAQVIPSILMMLGVVKGFKSIQLEEKSSSM